MIALLSILFLYLTDYVVSGQQLLANSRCNHWPDRGTCEHEFTIKWYYDRYDHRCRRFFYGGCDGNANRFDSLEECTSQCNFVEPTNRDRCFQPHNPGHCNADIERWYFDQDKKQCVCSWWSGCGGNSNIYYSYNHCMLICGDYATPGIGPGIDEKYWNRLNNHTMSVESQNVFREGSRFSESTYSVQVPVFDEQFHHPKYSPSKLDFHTINISHEDDGPSYLHALPVSSIPIVRGPKSDGVAIHRYDSEPRLLKVLDNKNWQIEEQEPEVTQNGYMKRRFKVQRKKTPPRMIHLGNKPYHNNEYRIQTAPNEQNQKVSYQIVRAQDNHATNHYKISQSLQDEAEETQRRIQESMRNAYYTKPRLPQPRIPVAQPVPAANTNANNYHPELVDQFKKHLDDHEKSLRSKLEAQFPDHVITLIPQIETVRYPDGRNVVRQRIQWTAHPKALYSNGQSPQMPSMQYERNQEEETTTTTTTTTPEPATEKPTISPHEIARMREEEQQRVFQAEMERRRAEEKRRREEHMRMLQEHQEKQKIERERLQQERERLEQERRREWEKSLRIITTPQPNTVIVTTASPVTYPTVPVRQVVYDANVKKQQPNQPETRAQAEPVDHYSPIVEQVSSAPLSIEEIIAMDNERSDYEDEYDVPMDFPDTESPPSTTTTTTPRPAPIRTTQRPVPAANLGMGAIVLPPTTPPKKSKLFSPISSEEYTQDIDFDPYVDFVM